MQYKIWQITFYLINLFVYDIIRKKFVGLNININIKKLKIEPKLYFKNMKIKNCIKTYEN